MKKYFKKGQEVWHIQSWDNAGTVRITKRRVHSCGTKIMRLINFDGTMEQQEFSAKGDGSQGVRHYRIVLAEQCQIYKEAKNYAAYILERECVASKKNIKRYPTDDFYVKWNTEELDKLKSCPIVVEASGGLAVDHARFEFNDKYWEVTNL